MFAASVENLSTPSLLLLVIAALVASAARGFSGFGGALIFMPVASAAIGPRSAAPVFLIIDGITAAALIPRAWRHSEKREVGTMAAGSLLGIPIGAAMLARADGLLIRWAIAFLVGLLLVLLMSGWRFRGRPRRAVCFGIGGLAGLFSGAAQVGGPPVVAYWLGRSRSGEHIRANIILYFAASTVIAAASYAAAGILTIAVIGVALITGPVYGAGLYLGTRLFGRASEAMFRRICYALIAAAVVLSLPALDSVPRPR